MCRSLLIIGGGTAGLSAGCYARMNGYDTTILEMEDTPGGLCTSWHRKGYMFDGSVAGLAGSAPGNSLYQLWEELGVSKYCPLYYGENFGHIHLPDHRIITVFADFNQLEKHLLEHFPAESKAIHVFLSGLRSIVDMDIPFSDGGGWEGFKDSLRTMISSLTHLPALIKYGTLSIREFTRKIDDPSLQIVFNNLVHFGGPDVPLLTIMLPLAYAHRKMAGIPQKGWLSFARAIESRFLELDGKILYRSKVTKLMIDNNIVKGVILSDGTQLFADRVLSAVDGRFTQSLLPNITEHDLLRQFNAGDLSDQPVQVNIGVNQDFSSINGPMTYILTNSFEAAGRSHNRFTMHNKFFDTSAASKGKSAITVFLDSEYLWWQNISHDPNQYQIEKSRCADHIISILDSYHPGFKEKVEVIDVSTPLTRERYTGNWMGAMQAKKPSSNMIKALLQSTPHYNIGGIDGLYGAGQWMEAWGGITTAAQSGRKAIQAMCKNDGIKFKAQKP